jgi:hypothetical protein
LRLRLSKDEASLVTITCDVKSAYMQLFRRVFDRVAIQSITEVEAILGEEMKHGNST